VLKLYLRAQVSGFKVLSGVGLRTPEFRLRVQGSGSKGIE
jgi:hypothetical protein